MSWLAAPNFRLSEADRAECQARCSLTTVSAWQGLQPGVALHWSCSQQSGLPQGKQHRPLQGYAVQGQWG